MKKLLADLRKKPVIAVVRKREDLSLALRSNVACLFLVAGDVTTVREDVAQTRTWNKSCFLYVDFVAGLGADKAAVKYIAREIKPTGLVTVKTHLIQLARDEGLLAIQNLFLLDSQAVATGLQSVGQCQPDLVEILPGTIPRVISDMTRLLPVPVVAGGLLETPSDIKKVLKAGAVAAAASNRELWTADLT